MVVADVRLNKEEGMTEVLRAGECLLAAEGKEGILLKVRGACMMAWGGGGGLYED